MDVRIWQTILELSYFRGLVVANFFMPLTPSQKEVVDTVEGHLVVIAGPGSGKTHTVIEKILNLFSTLSISEPYGLLAITFTNAAANEMRSRLRKKGFLFWDRVWIGTYHSFGYYLLSCYGSDIGIKENFDILSSDEQDEILKEIILRFSLGVKLKNLKSTIERLKRRGIYPGLGDANLDAKLRSAYAAYQERLKKDNYVDFGDLVALSVRLMHESKLAKRLFTIFFKYIIVDEFQDSDPQQLDLISAFISQSLGSTIVADDDQSIYKFRGAARENINIIKDRFNATEIILGQNFRSDQIVVEAAKMVIEKEVGRNSKKIEAVSNRKGALYKAEFLSEEQEADRVSQWIWQLHYSKEIENLGDIAIITRNRSRANFVLTRLDSLGIPWFDRAYLNFQDSWEVSFVLAILLLASDLEASSYLHQLMSAIEDGGLAYRTDKKDALDIAISIRERLLKLSPLVSILENAEHILNAANFESFIRLSCWSETEVKNTISNVKNLLSDLRRLRQEMVKNSQKPNIHIAELVERISGANVIQVMSGHASKGREFENVFLIGMEDDIIPSFRAHRKEDDIAEERRIFYVALTRAKCRIYITCALSRMMPWKKRKRQEISRFVKNIPAEFFSAIPFDS